MTAQLLDGERLAQRIKMELAQRAARLSANGRTPGLGTLLVGENPSSARYVEMKSRSARRSVFDPSTSTYLLRRPKRRSKRSSIDSTQSRCPFDPRATAVARRHQRGAGPAWRRSGKDVDGLHPTNLGRLVMGAPGPLPCTPAGIVELLAEYEVPVEGKHVVIIGRGLTIGRPLAC